MRDARDSPVELRGHSAAALNGNGNDDFDYTHRARRTFTRTPDFLAMRTYGSEPQIQQQRELPAGCYASGAAVAGVVAAAKPQLCMLAQGSERSSEQNVTPGRSLWAPLRVHHHVVRT